MTGDVQATFCATLVDEWVRGGVEHAVVAPGSRSTPMALALAAHPALRLAVHHDERAAAYLALGVGLATGTPAVVLTTSGTAAVELHPAVVEADLAGVPLIVVTADRPPELHQVGAPQTVDQQHLYGRSVRWFADPGVADHASRPTWRSLGARTLAEATTGVRGPGPVHLNLPLREPLVASAGELAEPRPGGSPWHTTAGRRSALDRAGTARLAELLDVDRGVIVAGADAGDPALVLELAEVTGWPVLADPRSGARVPAISVVGAFDAIVRHGPTAEQLRPDAVLWLGDRPASKVLDRWVAEAGAVEVAIHRHGRWIDPDHRAAHLLHADPGAATAALIRLVGARGERNAPWSRAWHRAEEAAQGAIDGALAGQDQLSEPGLARALVGALDDDATLVVSSSMPVRDVEWFGAPRTGLRVLANRGANGIDGVVSTAVGVALAATKTRSLTAALVGDVAFLHDANALIALAQREVRLAIVVVDNDGGGIFSFLPQADALDRASFEQLFGTPHGVDLASLVAAHGLAITEVAMPSELASALAEASAVGGVRVLRVRTDRQENVAVHEAIHAAVAATLNALA
jgi:2-succinyl-5-enolpyruvyl-6-hydroxy-3-cyclohexene-1-carboxylate synthase